MRMHEKSLATALLLAGLAIPALAGQDCFYASGALLLPHGDTSYMTAGPAGLGLEAGYRIAPADWDGMKVQFHVGQVRFNGGSSAGWMSNDPNVMQQKFSYDMVGNHYGVDVIWPVSAYGHDFTVFTGPDIHNWLVTRRATNGATISSDGVSVPTAFPSKKQGDNGPRAGWRLGVGYQVSKRLELTLSFTATEWRTQTADEMLYEQGANPSRPSYTSLSVSYHF